MNAHAGKPLQTTSTPAYKPVTGRKLPDPAFTPSARDAESQPLEPAARWRVTSGILHGAPSKAQLAGRRCTRRARGM